MLPRFFHHRLKIFEMSELCNNSACFLSKSKSPWTFVQYLQFMIDANQNNKYLPGGGKERNRVQALPSEQCEDESEQSCLFRKFESLSCTWDTGDVDSRRFGWLSSLEDELLYRRLCKLPEDDLELLTLLIVDGYRQADVARLWNCSRNVIYKRLKKIKIFLNQG